MFQVKIDFQTNVANQKTLPTLEQFTLWINSVESYLNKDTEISIAIVDNDEIKQLNSDYRNKDKPTNILSFASELYFDDQVPINFLGDLVMCQSVIEYEAKIQKKKLFDHWAHITIHGMLHLIGFDHIDENDAEKMENIEIEALRKLGISNPYLNYYSEN